MCNRRVTFPLSVVPRRREITIRSRGTLHKLMFLNEYLRNRDVPSLVTQEDVMTLRSQNLNLIPILQALLHSESVVGAANDVHLSQPAISGALARLRDALDDPILVRVGRGMRLTPRSTTAGTSRQDLHRHRSALPTPHLRSGRGGPRLRHRRAGPPRIPARQSADRPTAG